MRWLALTFHVESLGRRVAVAAVLCSISAVSVSAQTISRDSLYDYADRYWRGRLTVAAVSGDSLGITCRADANSNWGADVRFFASIPWSPDALSTSTSGLWGFSSSSTSSRMTIMWPDYDRDQWQIVFLSTSGRSVNTTRVATTSAGAVQSAGPQSGWLTNGAGFLSRLVKHGRVAITYPVSDWVRSFEMVFGDDQRAALKAMYDRCSKRYEGTQAPKAGT